MKLDIRKLLISLAIPLAAGALAALLSGDGMADYALLLAQPPLSPPGWVFPAVWTALYLMMGYSAYRVCTSGKDPAWFGRRCCRTAPSFLSTSYGPLSFLDLGGGLQLFCAVGASGTDLLDDCRLFQAG